MGFLNGSKGKMQQVSRLGPGQIPLYNQLEEAAMGSGAGGAFGDSADYYRGLLSDDSADFDAFAAPEMRRFNEEIIPGLSEQFAGMGSGALSSSGFRNSAVNAGADLSERLASLRANLRMQGAQGLNNIGQQGLGNFYENVYQPRTPGFLESAAPGLGAAAGMAAFGPLGGLAGSGFGKSQPYGGDTQLGYGNAGFYPKNGNYNPTGP